MQAISDSAFELDMRPAINLFDTFSEYAYAVKALCDDLDISQEELVVFPYIQSLGTNDNEKIRYVRKLLCLSYIDGSEVSVDKTFEIFDQHRKDFEERSQFGFSRKLEEESEEYYEPSDFYDENSADFV